MSGHRAIVGAFALGVEQQFIVRRALAFLAILTPIVEIAVELLFALAAIILVIAIERLQLPVAPASIMIVLVAAEAAWRSLPIAAY